MEDEKKETVTDGEEQKPQPEAGKETGKEKLFSQSEVDAIVSQRLEREKTQREKAADKARKEAEDAAAKERGDWQKLAEARDAELKDAHSKLSEMDSLKVQFEAANSALSKILDRERKDLSKPIIALLDKLSPVEQLEWLAENKAAITGGTDKKLGTPPPNQARKINTPALNNNGQRATGGAAVKF